jgi:hypothetical protein
VTVDRRTRPEVHALGYPYEVRSEDEYFDEIDDVKITKDMLELAKHMGFAAFDRVCCIPIRLFLVRNRKPMS